MFVCYFLGGAFLDEATPIPHSWVGIAAIGAGVVMCVMALLRRRRTTLRPRRRP